MSKSTLKSLGRTLAAIAVTLTSAAAANAAPLLGLTQQLPDISAGFILVSYDPSTGSFSATGVPQQLTVPPATTTSITGPRSFSLAAVLPNSGAGAVSGSFAITGNLGAGSTTLLAGTLAQASFNNATVANSTLFEFTFNITTAAPAFAGYSTAGMILGAGALTNASGAACGAADSSCTNNNMANADTFGLGPTTTVPEPTTLALLGSGLLFGAARRRKR